MSDLKDKIKQLFVSNHVQVETISLDYENTNDIFEVSTDEGCCIVKVPKVISDPHNAFWTGLENLFGLNALESIKNQASVSEHVEQYGAIDVPRVFKTDATSDNPIGKPYVMLEKMHGEPVPKDSELEQEIMQSADYIYQLGVHLGSLHLQNQEYFGTLNQHQYPMAEFPEKLSKTISKLGHARKALQDPGVQQMLPRFVDEALNMKAPNHLALIMPDLWPSQFLAMHDHLSACIDIEACVVGPVALELTLIELWIGQLGKFKEGYFSVNNHWPEEIEDHRELYRYFLFLLYGCPDAGLDACIHSSAKFPQRDRVRARISSPRLVPPGYPRLR